MADSTKRLTDAPIAPQKRSKAFAGATCPGCGELFTPTRPNQRHCRPSCRRRALEPRRDAQVAVLAEPRALPLFE